MKTKERKLFIQAKEHFVNKEFKKSLELCLELIQSNPTEAELLFYIGRILIIDAQFPLALKFLEQAYFFDKNLAGLENSMAFAYSMLGDYERAYDFSEKAFLAKPEEKTNLSSMIYEAFKDPLKTLCDIQNLALKYHDLYLSQIKKLDLDFSNRFLSSKSKLNLGFISGDLRDHTLARSFLPLLENLDKNKFEFNFYSTNLSQDILTSKFKDLAKNFTIIKNLKDEQVIDLILQDQIDILFDLSGFTANERLEILKYKPAPVQISYLGFFSTLGIPEVDYLFADNYVVRDGEEKYFTEQIYKFPNMAHACFMLDMPESSHKLPYFENQIITFASMNNFHKISKAMLSIWAKILLKVPSSRLLIDSRNLNDKYSKQQIIDFFDSYGISETRLYLKSTQDRQEFLKTYNEVDIALDPFPYSGSCTSIESLRMGVPIITMEGNKWSSRMTGTILYRLGYADLIASNEDEYIHKAVELASDIDRLNYLRKNLRTNIDSSKINLETFTKDFEQALWTIWNAKKFDYLQKLQLQ